MEASTQHVQLLYTYTTSVYLLNSDLVLVVQKNHSQHKQSESPCNKSYDFHTEGSSTQPGQLLLWLHNHNTGLDRHATLG